MGLFIHELATNLERSVRVPQHTNMENPSQNQSDTVCLYHETQWSVVTGASVYVIPRTLSVTSTAKEGDDPIKPLLRTSWHNIAKYIPSKPRSLDIQERIRNMELYQKLPSGSGVSKHHLKLNWLHSFANNLNGGLVVFVPRDNAARKKMWLILSSSE